MLNIADGDRRIGQRGNRGESLHGVGNGVHIQHAVNPLEARRPLYLNVISSTGYGATHALQQIDKMRIALQRVGVEMHAQDTPACHRRRREEVRSIGSIRLDHIALSAVALACLNRILPIMTVISVYPKMRHHPQRNVDIRLGNDGSRGW